MHTVLDNTTLMSTEKLLKLVDECRRYSKPKQCRLRDMVYSMTEKKQFPGFMFMFHQVVQKQSSGKVGPWDNKSPFDSILSVINISAKNKQNRLMCVEVIVCNISVVFETQCIFTHLFKQKILELLGDLVRPSLGLRSGPYWGTSVV